MCDHHGYLYDSSYLHVKAPPIKFPQMGACLELIGGGWNTKVLAVKSLKNHLTREPEMSSRQLEINAYVDKQSKLQMPLKFTVLH